MSFKLSPPITSFLPSSQLILKHQLLFLEYREQVFMEEMYADKICRNKFSCGLSPPTPCCSQHGQCNSEPLAIVSTSLQLSPSLSQLISFQLFPPSSHLLCSPHWVTRLVQTGVCGGLSGVVCCWAVWATSEVTSSTVLPLRVIRPTRQKMITKVSLANINEELTEF